MSVVNTQSVPEPSLERPCVARPARAGLMVLLCLRASKDGTVLCTVAKPVQASTVIKEPIDAFVRELNTDFELEAIHIHADASYGSPFTELGLDTLGEISASELSGIGKFIDLRSKGREEQAAPAAQRNAFDVLSKGSKEVHLPAKSEMSRYDWLIFNALIDHLKADKLGFSSDLVKEGGAGKGLLLALKALLNYVLPFDDEGVFKVPRL